ncbi:MAG: helix-turn-helix domain-containing protein [Thermoguttaceae bacterium]|nr:helix-turn-helix domain-containing protein [Thermoguttaceae bacterium]
MRIVLALRGQPMCVCQIVELLQLANSTVSEHLTILKAAGLVTARKDGRWIYYRLSDRCADGVAHEALACLVRVLEQDRQVQSDARQLTKILRIDPGELCRRQKSAGGKCCAR